MNKFENVQKSNIIKCAVAFDCLKLVSSTVPWIESFSDTQGVVSKGDGKSKRATKTFTEKSNISDG